MKSVLVNLFFLRKYIFIYLFCYFYISIVAAERGGLLYLKFLCYKNDENKLSNGEICEIYNPNRCRPTFTICISNQNITDRITKAKCNVHFQMTRTYYHYDLICNKPYGRRKYLEMEIKKDLSLPLQKTYFVKIEVRHDWWSYSPLIASFGAEFNQIPSENALQVVYKDMRMNRTDLSHRNPRVSLDISMGLQCDRDRFGEDCMNLCPHCYPNYTTCSNNPCQNEGICTPKKFGEIGYNCQCKYPFSGPQCTNIIDICESKPCKNNASCHYIKPDAFNCKCLPGFRGELCDQVMCKDNGTNSNFRKYVFLICSLFFVILIMNLVIVFVACFIKKRRAKKNKKLQQIDEKPMSKKELERIDLVPNCETTFGSDPLQISDSD